MLGLLVLFFIGKAFYTLAQKHNRNKWLFAILGIVVCYGMITIGALLVVFIAIAVSGDGILNNSDTVLGLMGVPVGLLSAWLFHHLLRKNWEGNPKDQNSDLLDSSNF
mgnify:CR=1 FL=1|jgi:hypothetical protein